LSMNGIENVMERILNERVKMEQRVPIAAVKVKGFPSAMNKYQLGAIFANLIIKSIDLCEEGKDKCCDGDEHLTPSTNNNTNAQYALIEFANKFHAAQAAIHYNGYRVDSKHELLVVPVHAEVLMNI
uniref:RRM domain-containing protein n=1 Tax=Anisakis simplex TaxID=6269 RepID=A0A0M3J3Z8_ANISI